MRLRLTRESGHSKWILLFGAFHLMCGAAVAQPIKGRVLNEGGRAAPYVSVKCATCSNAVYTNDSGRFSIVPSHLPDTLYLSSPGFEPYRVLITNETVLDPAFEIVLLNSRRKIRSDDVASTIAVNRMPGVKAQNNAGQATSSPYRSYLAGKKLVMADSLTRSGVIYRSGLLTAAEINGLAEPELFSDLTSGEVSELGQRWRLRLHQHFLVQVENESGQLLMNRPVALVADGGDTAWRAVTDNKGMATLWPNVHDSTERSYRIVMRDAKNIDHPVPVPDGINVLVVNDDCASPRAVDIVVAVDATGSMYGEIDFLKIELENVLRNTFSAYPELNLHAGSVFYRDRGDEYVARWTPLQTDLLKVLNFIKLQRATGGGDVPEAVHIALQTAIDTLKWRDDARTRILLLVTDAPPHLETRDRLYELISKASERGIRVVPVICMGADKSTEYFMRCLSVLTNGTYVFLADDSNADFSPAQPGQLVLPVQFLSSLLERVIREMVTAENCSLPAMQAAAQQPAGDVRLSVASRKMLLIEATPSIHEGYITDNSGRILLKVLRPFGKLKWLIDLSALGNGSYFFRYRGTDAAMHTVRFAWNR